MKILVIGGGGRCHAIVEKCKQSKLVNEVFCAPGNMGMKDIATLVNIKDSDIETLCEFAVNNAIDLTIVGPEVPLSMGVVDLFKSKGLKIFGCDKSAARIESSKQFAKDLMKKYNVPTAEYEVFDNYENAVEYIKKVGAPIVLKFDGLAFGKGVVVCETLDHALETIDEMLNKKVFGDGKVVVEECLVGVEFSLMALVNKDIVVPLDIAQDHKREYDGDKGANTGGMGAYSPVPFITDEDIKYSMDNIMQVVADAMITENTPFTGVLYGGLMKTAKGIKVIEFNARFGDPETEVVLPRMESDLVEVILSLLDGNKPEVKFSNDVALGVVMATKGYPREYTKGHVIGNLENVPDVYHMGTGYENGNYTTNGGRVLFVLGRGENFQSAQQNAYEKVAQINCDMLINRTDIGYQVINFEKGNK